MPRVRHKPTLQDHALVFISDENGAEVKNIAKHLKIKAENVSALLYGMKNKGLVESFTKGYYNITNEGRRQPGKA